MGGMQVLQWAASYPDVVFAALPIVAPPYHSAQNIAFDEVGRQGGLRRPDGGWGLLGERGGFRARPCGGADVRADHLPVGGGAEPRGSFGRRLQNAPKVSLEAIGLFGEMFEVEQLPARRGAPPSCSGSTRNSYLTHHPGEARLRPFAADYQGDLANAFRGTRRGSCWRRSPRTGCSDSGEPSIARALNRAGANVSFVEISDKGGTTRSCWTSRTSIRRWRSWRVRADAGLEG